MGAGLLAKAVCQSPDTLTDTPNSRASPLPHVIFVEAKKMPRLERGGAFFMAFRKSAVASQQRWFLTTRTAWQLVQLLRCREAIRFRLLVDDLRRRATARVLYRRLGRARLIVTGRAAVVAARVFATGLAVTRCAITRAAALGRRGTGGAAAAVARGVLATALWLAATWSACALGRSPWTTATALGRFCLLYTSPSPRD